eukprot:667168_1
MVHMNVIFIIGLLCCLGVLSVYHVSYMFHHIESFICFAFTLKDVSLVHLLLGGFGPFESYHLVPYMRCEGISVSIYIFFLYPRFIYTQYSVFIYFFRHVFMCP